MKELGSIVFQPLTVHFFSSPDIFTGYFSNASPPVRLTGDKNESISNGTHDGTLFFVPLYICFRFPHGYVSQALSIFRGMGSAGGIAGVVFLIEHTGIPQPLYSSLLCLFITIPHF